MKRSLVVLAGLIVLAGAVEASASGRTGRTVKPSAAKKELTQSLGGDGNLPIPDAEPLQSQDDSSGQNRIDMLEEVGSYGVASSDLCGFHVKVDKTYRQIYLEAISNPFSAQDCPSKDLGRVLVANCRGNDAHDCAMANDAVFRVLDDSSFVILGSDRFAGRIFKYASESVLTFAGKMKTIGEKPCETLGQTLADGAVAKCAARGFKSCETVKSRHSDKNDMLRLQDNDPVPGGYLCEGTVTVDGKAIAPAPKHHWWQ